MYCSLRCDSDSDSTLKTGCPPFRPGFIGYHIAGKVGHGYIENCRVRMPNTLGIRYSRYGPPIEATNLPRACLVRQKDKRRHVDDAGPVTGEEKKKQRALVVDDYPQVLMLIEIDLRLLGFEVITATSGKEALHLVESAEPDIMLLDISMPGMDGFEVLRRLRTFTQLPVITMSGSQSNRDDAIRLGANDFISKPFHRDDLALKIKAVLNR